MNSDLKQSIKDIIRTISISVVLTSVFMYFFYFQGWQSIAAGICIGSLIPIFIFLYTEFVARKYLIKVNLLVLLTVNTIAHLIVIFGIAIIFVVIFYMKGDFGRIFNNLSFLYSQYFLIGVGFGLALALLFNFFYILNSLIGRRILGKLFIGMYRKPIEVERVFMFLDIKSSTTIAEQIGHLKFLSLVNDFFYDITEPVRKSKGEIYKYVGDEVIITWKYKDGMQEANCIRCFSLIDSTIQAKSDIYMKRYGVIPEFKAGLHCGVSVTGELGYTKREIAYMGDVLNTTSRIEEACNQYDEKLLASKDLLDKIKLPEMIKTTEVGEVSLRGKEHKIALFAIRFD